MSPADAPALRRLVLLADLTAAVAQISDAFVSLTDGTNHVDDEVSRVLEARSKLRQALDDSEGWEKGLR